MVRAFVAIVCASACSTADPVAEQGRAHVPIVRDVTAEPDVAAVIDRDQVRVLDLEQGTLKIDFPPKASTGQRTLARLSLTPAVGYKVDTGFPVRLTLEAPAGMVLERDEFSAGGEARSRGDAEVLNEHRLVFSVAIVATLAATYQINGVYRAAICDAHRCFPKRIDVALALEVR